MCMVNLIWYSLLLDIICFTRHVTSLNTCAQSYRIAKCNYWHLKVVPEDYRVGTAFY